MNLRDLGVVFAIGVIGVGLAVAFVAFFGGCRRGALVEPAYTETVAAEREPEPEPEPEDAADQTPLPLTRTP